MTGSATNFTRPTGFIENERNRVSIEKESSSRLFILDRFVVESNIATLLRGEIRPKFVQTMEQREISAIISRSSIGFRFVRKTFFLENKKKNKKKRNHSFETN